jgi:hypothetical protein
MSSTASASTASPSTAAATAATANTVYYASSQPAPGSLAALPGYKWRRAAFLCSGGAQFISIAAIVSAYTLPSVWAPVLLAVVPVFLGALVAFGPVSVARLAAIAAAVVIVLGLIGDWRLGILFLPALVSLVIGAVALRRTA